MNAISVRSELRKLSNPEKSRLLRGFFKTGPGQYGEGDVFLGITVPQSWLVAKKYSKISLPEIRKLLRSKIHEERSVALMILVERFRSSDEKTKKQIFDFYLSNKKWVNNWDLVDMSAHQIVGAHLHGKKKPLLDRLARSKNLWDRRIAIVSTFHQIRLGDPEWTFRLSEKYLQDTEDLIHKAAGWMLRETGKRCSVQKLEKFLKKNLRRMPRTMLRYAIEKFPPAKRKKYLLK